MVKERKGWKGIAEYDALKAELLRRNPEYAEEAKNIKAKWEHHVKPIRPNSDVNFTSDEYVAFCGKWGLKSHPDYFLDPDNLKDSVKGSPFKESPSGHVEHVFPGEIHDIDGQLIYNLKPKADKVYLEIDPFITKEDLVVKIEALIGHLRGDTRKRLDTIKFDIAVWDSLVSGSRSIEETARFLSKSLDVTQKAAIRAYERITGKPYHRRAYEDLGIAAPGFCDSCHERNNCTALCRKAEKYAGLDEVTRREGLSLRVAAKDDSTS